MYCCTARCDREQKCFVRCLRGFRSAVPMANARTAEFARAIDAIDHTDATSLPPPSNVYPGVPPQVRLRSQLLELRGDHRRSSSHRPAGETNDGTPCNAQLLALRGYSSSRFLMSRAPITCLLTFTPVFYGSVCRHKPRVFRQNNKPMTPTTNHKKTNFFNKKINFFSLFQNKTKRRRHTQKKTQV